MEKMIDDNSAEYYAMVGIVNRLEEAFIYGRFNELPLHSGVRNYISKRICYGNWRFSALYDMCCLLDVNVEHILDNCPKKTFKHFDWGLSSKYKKQGYRTSLYGLIELSIKTGKSISKLIGAIRDDKN